MNKIKILISIWLLVGVVESGLIIRRASSSCSWTGHCAGDSCSTDDDCDGSLTCTNGICGGSSSSNGGSSSESGGSSGGGSSGSCSPSGELRGTSTNCNTENNSECCKAGVYYPQYTCSPSTSNALLTLNSFEEGGDGGGGGVCTGAFYPDSERVIALSTGWYNDGSRCGKMITIIGNGHTTTAKVVDECDSVHGCDSEHDGQPPCRNNIVDGSSAVWAALGISKNDPRYGEMAITWYD